VKASIQYLTQICLAKASHNNIPIITGGKVIIVFPNCTNCLVKLHTALKNIIEIPTEKKTNHISNTFWNGWNVQKLHDLDRRRVSLNSTNVKKLSAAVSLHSAFSDLYLHTVRCSSRLRVNIWDISASFAINSKR